MFNWFLGGVFQKSDSKKFLKKVYKLTELSNDINMKKNELNNLEYELLLENKNKTIRGYSLWTRSQELIKKPNAKPLKNLWGVQKLQIGTDNQYSLYTGKINGNLETYWLDHSSNIS